MKEKRVFVLNAPLRIGTQQFSIHLGQEFAPKFVHCEIASDWSAYLAAKSILDDFRLNALPITRNQQLDRFESDTRQIVVEGVISAFEYAIDNSIPPEEAFFMTKQGMGALGILAWPPVDVMKKCPNGCDSLLIGHSPALEAAYVKLYNDVTRNTPLSLNLFGGRVFDELEGFVAFFDQVGAFVRAELIRRSRS